MLLGYETPRFTFSIELGKNVLISSSRLGYELVFNAPLHCDLYRSVPAKLLLVFSKRAPPAPRSRVE